MRVYILVFIVFCVGLFVRTWRLDRSFVLTFDTGRDLQIVSEISQGNLTLVGPAVGGLTGIFLGPLTYYYTLPLYTIAQGNPIIIVMLHGLISALLIPLVYVMARKLGLKPAWAIFFIGWFAILSGSIDQARVLWNPSLTPLLLLPLFACMLWVEQKPWLLVLASGLLGLSLQTQLYTALVAPIFAVWMVTDWLMLLKKSHTVATTKQLLMIAVAAVVTGGLTFLPQLAFEFRHNFPMTQTFLRSFGEESQRVSWAVMMENRPQVIMQALSSSWHTHYSNSAFWWLGFVCAGLGILSRKNSLARWLLALLSVPLLFFLIYTGNHGYFFDYYLNSHYLWIFLSVMLIMSQLQMSPLEKKVLFSITTLLAVTSIWQYAPVTKQHLFSYTFAQQLEAWQTLYEAQEDHRVTVEVFTPNLLPVQYEYINDWYARTHHLTPAEFNQNLSGNKDVFLLYEAPFAGGSSLAFQDWSQRHHQAGQCHVIKTLGVITVEKCRLNDS